MGRDLEEPANLNPIDWHTRYLQQSRWTEEVRKYLYQRASIQDARKILEVGCGSGVICSDLQSRSRAMVVGLDKDQSILRLAKDLDQPTGYANANAIHLPFPSKLFDATVCHYFLLWAHDPLIALSEMKRVCRTGGAVIALAEPDYGGRIDHPDELVPIGKLQTESLRRQGADPLAGRKLLNWFNQAGLVDIEHGILGGRWAGKSAKENLHGEWKMMRHDLDGLLSQDEIKNYQILDENAWEYGNRVLFIPTFFAFGRVK